MIKTKFKNKRTKKRICLTLKDYANENLGIDVNINLFGFHKIKLVGTSKIRKMNERFRKETFFLFVLFKNSDK
jgi:hypothetical protein